MSQNNNRNIQQWSLLKQVNVKDGSCSVAPMSMD
jgi:hypothetical protein